MAIAAVTACTNPVSPGSPHLEAVDVRIIDRSAQVLAATDDNARWTGGPLALPAADSLPLRVEFLDLFGAPFTLEGRREHTLRGEIEAPRIAQWESRDGRGTLRALMVGVTRVRFHIWHGTHADFTSPWLEVRVTSPIIAGVTR
jgi:hypothetical protein